MSELALSSGCRTIKNDWNRFWVIFFHQVLMMSSFVRMGAIYDKDTFLHQLKENIGVGLAIIIASVYFLNKIQEFAD